MNLILIINLEKVLINITSSDPHLVILLGDFNAKSKSWSVNDTTSEEGTILENLTSLYGMKQLISDPTHILESAKWRALLAHMPYVPKYISRTGKFKNGNFVPICF